MIFGNICNNNFVPMSDRDVQEMYSPTTPAGIWHLYLLKREMSEASKYNTAAWPIAKEKKDDR